MATETKYHVNRETGRAGICRATKKGCPLGADTPHFDTKEEAKEYITQEAAKNNDTFSTVKKNKGAIKASRRGISYSVIGVVSKMKSMGYSSVKPVYEHNVYGPDTLLHYQTKDGTKTDGVQVRSGYPYNNITIEQAITLPDNGTLSKEQYNAMLTSAKKEQGLKIYNQMIADGVPVSINKANGDVHVWAKQSEADYANYVIYKLPVSKEKFDRQINKLIDIYKNAEDTLKNISTYQTLEDYKDRALQIYDDRGLGSSRQREMNRFLEELHGDAKEEQRELYASGNYDAYGPLQYFRHYASGLNNKIVSEDNKKDAERKRR